MSDVFMHEGGYVDHQSDKGGATAYGISLRFLKSLPELAGDIDGDGHVNTRDIQQLTPEMAAEFYKTYFWDHYRLDRIADQSVQTKMFNLFVNMRGKTAGLVAQRAANDLGTNLVEEDGRLGSLSFAAINELNPEQLLVCIKYQAWRVYKAIVAHDATQIVFLDGWRNRAFA
ncbi:MAG: hypothetical protein CMH98_13820 [Oceanospirillaceae bacterium]|nr:hypothetical protein [Oceanospirillaceae bacterium]